MPKGLISESSMNNIASAIQVLNGTENTYTPAQMDDAIIDAIPSQTVSGSLAHITNAAKYNAESVVVNIEPVQEGSGDPSPENIRPITGWTGIELTKTGKNLLGVNIVQGGLSVNGEFISANNRVRTDYIPIKGGQIYKLTSNLKVRSTYAYKNTEKIGLILNNANGAVSPSLTIPETASSIVIGFKGASDTDIITPADLEYAQLELGSTATTYEPYQGVKFPVTFPQGAGIVYGGEVDLTTGTLTVTDANIAAYDGETLPSTWISDRDVYVAGTSPTTGAQVVYKLATPIEYQLTPQQLEMFKLENNIWADTGDTSVTYKVDLATYIAELQAAQASASAASLRSLNLLNQADELQAETDDIKDTEDIENTAELLENETFFDS